MIRIILSAVVLFIGTPALTQTPSPSLVVIAHRGASGERPEHTRAAYDLAIDQGADVIEPDLVMSRDGVLIVRHENEISETTDVADHPRFAGRRATRVIDGVSVTGWFTEDFTLAELGMLRARERLPALRPDNAAFDGQAPILTFQEVIDIARAGSVRTGRVIGVAPELKHPSYFAGVGLPMEDAFIAILVENGLDGADAPALVQCFEVEPLRRLRARIATPLVQLMSASGGPADRSGTTYAAMATPDGLAAIAAYADAVGVETALILPRDDSGASQAPTSLIADAHAAGLAVHAWTFRAENAFLPLEHRRGDDPGAHGDLAAWLARFQTLGLDGAFTDFPGLVR